MEGIRTALYKEHVALGAKMVPFAGYLMPLQYSGQIAEHQAVRTGMGLFDLSHMGEFRLSGPGALAAADALVTNRLAGTSPGQAVYSPMCLENGGIVDDLIVYHLEDSILLVVNASNIDKDETWVRDHLPRDVVFSNESEATSLIAIQGPGTQPFLAALTDVEIAPMDTYTAGTGSVAGVPCLVSRTGYTGEDGFELYVASDRARELWSRLVEEGGDALAPIGLAARDTLRFEMGYCLYGNDIDEETTPLEAGLGWTVKLEGDSFVGQDALVRQKEEGVSRRLVGLVPEGEKTIPRRGYTILDGDRETGRVTSGTFSPSLNRGLAMGYVSAEASKKGNEVSIDIRGRKNRAVVTRMPFYSEGSRKAPPRPKSIPTQEG